MIGRRVFIHPKAEVDESVDLGEGTKVWQFATVVRGAVLGRECNVAPGAMLDGPRFGDRCIICQGAGAGPGFLVGNDVFVGPNVALCNDFFPRSSKDGFDVARYRAGEWAIVIEDEAVLCAGAVILPGVRIGKGAMIGAGVIVSRDVPAGMLLRRDGQLVEITDRMRARRMRFASLEPAC